MTIPEIAALAQSIIADLYAQNVIDENAIWDHSRPWGQVAAETLETHLQRAFNRGLQAARDEAEGFSTALLHQMICNEDGNPV